MRNRVADSWKGLLIVAILFAVVSLWSIVTGVMGLAGRNKADAETFFEKGYQKGDFFDGEITYCSDCVLCMKHTINFIPAAYEYYYVIMSDDLSKAVMVRADKHYGENFVDGEAVTPVKAKGRVKSTEYETRRELESVQNDLAAMGVYLSVDTYLDLLSTKYYALRIVSGVSFIAIMAGFALLLKSKNGSRFVSSENGMDRTELKKTTEGKIFIVLVLLMTAALVLSLHLMEMR